MLDIQGIVGGFTVSEEVTVVPKEVHRGSAPPCRRTFS